MSQIQTVPGPSQAAFDTLSDQMAQFLNCKYATTTITTSARGTAAGPFTHTGYSTIDSSRYIVGVFPFINYADYVFSINVHSNRHTIYLNSNYEGTVTVGYLYEE